MTTKPNPDLMKTLGQKKSQEPKPGGLAAEYRTGEDKVPTKKATFELPRDLHRALHLHAVSNGVSMRDLVMRYIENGLRADDAAEQEGTRTAYAQSQEHAYTVIQRSGRKAAALRFGD